ncbi:MAG: hypothetical protein JWQ40_4713 [Segetibacter sp.]|nr:hypothetical protein [Segetibacter sp.]
MHVLYVTQLIISWLLIVAVLLPFIKNDYWVFRILEYPRYQKLILCVFVLSSLLLNNIYTNAFGLITFVLLGFCVAYLLYKICPYTRIYKMEMKSIGGRNKENQVKLYTANVYQDNTDYDKILSQIDKYQPDIVLLLETDKVWEKQMDVLIKNYPHCFKAPLPNTYGLLFYSKFTIIEGAVKYLVEKDIPSLEAVIELPSKQHIKIWGLHPKPPVPGEDNRSTAKDKELMKVALKAKKEKLPVIVMGDLNDVAWSYVTELFRKTTGLLDPRRGRGFYSTFSANHWFMRFPLDYVFCSSHFGLVHMERLAHNGSDHFPMFSHFEYVPELEKVQDKPHADSKEKREVSKKAKRPV